MEKQSQLKRRYTAFFNHPVVRIISGILALMLAYIFASLAIDSGSLLDYAITVLLIIVGLRELAGGIFSKRRER